MDMIRWLATNKVVLTVWGLGILAILLASIFGGGKDAEHAAAPVETKAVEVVAEKAKPVPAAVEVVAEKAKAAPAVVAAAATGAAAVVASTVQAAVDTSTEASVEANVSEEVEAKAVEVVAQSEDKAVEAVDTSADSSAASDQVAAVEDDSLAGKSSDDLLMMAREAYWDNGLDKAANLYSELIAREPTVIEHKGELGNVFWRQGYPKKAAELYADIAQPMIENGNGERVSNMVGFIGLFFPERATSIRTLLDAQ